MNRQEIEATARLLAHPADWRSWGISEGRLVRQVGTGPGEVEDVRPDEIVACLQRLEKAAEAPIKPLSDRAFDLLLAWIGTNVRPQTVQSDTEELPREAVRWCRALESEVAQATTRPEEKAPRAARRPRDEEDDEVYR